MAGFDPSIEDRLWSRLASSPPAHLSGLRLGLLDLSDVRPCTAGGRCSASVSRAGRGFAPAGEGLRWRLGMGAPHSRCGGRRCRPGDRYAGTPPPERCGRTVSTRRAVGHQRRRGCLKLLAKGSLDGSSLGAATATPPKPDRLAAQGLFQRWRAVGPIRANGGHERVHAIGGFLYFSKRSLSASRRSSWTLLRSSSSINCLSCFDTSGSK